MAQGQCTEAETAEVTWPHTGETRLCDMSMRSHVSQGTSGQVTFERQAADQERSEDFNPKAQGKRMRRSEGWHERRTVFRSHLSVVTVALLQLGTCYQALKEPIRSLLTPSSSCIAELVCGAPEDPGDAVALRSHSPAPDATVGCVTR